MSAAPKTHTARLEAARAYLSRGWTPLPIPLREKAPRMKAWTEFRPRLEDLERHFGGPGNLGILLGEPSAGLTDVDLDAPEALALAGRFLPETARVHGRPSKPCSHRWYVSTDPVRTERFEATDGSVIVELRSTGGQTVVPPSRHPTGELLSWEREGEPARIAGAELRRAVARLAAAALLVRHYPVAGSRHALALALAGALLRGGFGEEDATAFVDAVATAAGDRETRDRVAAVRSTARRLAAGEPAQGGPSLERLLDPKVVERLRAWLDLRSPANAPARPLSAFFADAGFDALTEHPSIEAIEAVLRRLGAALATVDPARRAAARAEAKRRLAALKVRGAAPLVDAALAAPPRDDDGSDLQGAAVAFESVEPWPEPVDGAAVLDDILATIERFVALPPGAAPALALWTVHAWALDAAQVSPLLVFASPERRCGKTTALALLGALVPRALHTANLSPAALFRAVERFRPTLLVDEADCAFTQSEELRALVAAGHLRASATVIRVCGEDFEPRCFSAWCPKAIALIGRLPGTLEDRSLVVPMRRRAPGEHIERLRLDRLSGDLLPLRRRLARWCADRLDGLRAADPAVPDALDDRAQDNARPLVAIADAAGGPWPARAREAILTLCAHRDDPDAASRGVRLLADIRAIFEARGVDRLSTSALVAALKAIEEAPWGDLGRGRELTPRRLAAMLKTFGIAPLTVWLDGGETAKGYKLESFEDAFSRYVPTPPLRSVIASGSAPGADLRAKNDPSGDGRLTDQKFPETRAAQATCRDDGLKTPFPGEDEKNRPFLLGDLGDDPYLAEERAAIREADAPPPPGPPAAGRKTLVLDEDGLL